MDSVSLLGPPQPPKVMNQDEFDSRFNFVPNKKRRTNREVFRQLFIQNFREYRRLNDILPFLTWIREYDVKTAALRDFLGSLLLSALIIPQGIANGLLISNVFCGMFSVLIPNLIYPFLGSSRHCSLGSLSIVSILIYSSIKYTGSSISTITLCCGIFQLLYFLLPLDFLLHFISSNLLVGFGAGVSLRIAFQLLSSVFKFSDLQCGDIINNMCMNTAVSCVRSIELTPVAIFLVSLIILLIFKWKLNEVLFAAAGTAAPHELIVLLLMSAINKFLPSPAFELLDTHLYSRIFSVNIPAFPSAQTVVDAFAIFLLSLSLHIKVVKWYRKSQNVHIKQESLCASVISVISSPLGLLPPMGSRMNAQITREAKSFSLLSNLLSVVWTAPLLYFGYTTVVPLIPKSAVIALVIASISDVWIDIRHLRLLYSLYIWDAVVSTCALLSALIIPNLCVAFLVSIAFALFSVSLRTHWSKCDVMIRVAENYFAEENRYEGECPDSPLSTLRINTPLIFINCETVREAIRMQAVAVKKLIGIGIGSRSPSIRSQVPGSQRDSIVAKSSNNLTNIIITQDSHDLPRLSSTHSLQLSVTETVSLRFIILDCVGMSYVDPEAITMLNQIYSELRASNIKLFFAAVNANVRDFFEINRLFSQIPRNNFFPSVQEALTAVRILSSPFHMSVSMNGCRDVVALSTAPSHQDLMYRLSPEPV